MDYMELSKTTIAGMTLLASITAIPFYYMERQRRRQDYREILGLIEERKEQLRELRNGLPE